MKEVKEFLSENMNIEPRIYDLVSSCEREVEKLYEKWDEIAEFNQYKVLDAFQKNEIADRHFAWNTGYGYDDIGREATEQVYADVFHTEAALVRPTIVNGTHALSLALTGVLRPGDELIYASGQPYDTLEETIGIRGEGKGSLKDFGVSYKQLELLPDGNIDIDSLQKSIGKNTKMVALQRATGYNMRKAVTIENIKECFDTVKEKNPNVICMTDNCYGEFLDELEPTDVGADIIAGSLIKNPGGGLALTGGYIAGRRDLIDLVSYRMTTPGIGGECGLTFGQTRTVLQGLFIAPKTVNGAVKGAVLCGKVFEKLGFEVCPKPGEARSDIIQAVKLKSPEAVISFCQGIQAASPVDAHVKPAPWDMPGYEDRVIMAAGAFVQGSSIELSADAPLREPYCVYFQGGLTYEHSKFGVLKAVQKLLRDGIINI